MPYAGVSYYHSTLSSNPFSKRDHWVPLSKGRRWICTCISVSYLCDLRLSGLTGTACQSPASLSAMTVRDRKSNPGNILCSSGDDSGIHKSSVDIVSATYLPHRQFTHSESVSSRMERVMKIYLKILMKTPFKKNTLEL